MSPHNKSRFLADGNDETDERAFVGVPQCPKELDEVAKKKWKELVKLLTAMDLITKAHRDLMELYCRAYSRRQAAETMLSKLATS